MFGLQVVSISLLKLVSRNADVAFPFSVVFRRYVSLVNHALCKAFSSAWVFIGSSAIAIARAGVVCRVVLFSVSSQDTFVVFVDKAFDIPHTTVTYTYCVSVK